ncbi:hypothetical protein CJ030_MR2G024402 [Morella rubra]|uniref:DUF789 domain-containing protein n=1 Tax=Morella rubra TaxID=262757 RepID=A0A6A1WFW0_9ROSI|nr:hypothetical protein CJ030_MR2G024433 [Morella rubra]KAB1224193.1 hypothetical protein CJ030_MR2G024402 [Morella rubra]
MPSSPWDMPLLSKFHNPNLQCFIESVTPTVSTRTTLLPKARFQKLSCLPQSVGKDPVEHFSLSDLWNFYVERSVYGAAVPMLLNDGDTVVQYYSPSLSAVQIYTCRPLVSVSVHGYPLLARFDRGSWNEDSENDKMSMAISKTSSRTSQATSYDSTVDHEGPSQIRELLGHLYCQFNETMGPYERINELAKNYVGLKKFKSVDLSPYSWMATAWYPIYQIPVTRNVKELSACFLTYHLLSSSCQGLPSRIPEEEADKFQCIGSLGKKDGGRTSLKGEVSLSPFALATYKIQGDLWMNPAGTPDHKERIISYQNAAHSWLKQIGFQHNDFNFFISRT